MGVRPRVGLVQLGVAALAHARQAEEVAVVLGVAPAQLGVAARADGRREGPVAVVPAVAPVRAGAAAGPDVRAERVEALPGAVRVRLGVAARADGRREGPVAAVLGAARVRAGVAAGPDVRRAARGVRVAERNVRRAAPDAPREERDGLRAERHALRVARRAGEAAERDVVPRVTPDVVRLEERDAVRLHSEAPAEPDGRVAVRNVRPAGPRARVERGAPRVEVEARRVHRDVLAAEPGARPVAVRGPAVLPLAHRAQGVRLAHRAVPVRAVLADPGQREPRADLVEPELRVPPGPLVPPRTAATYEASLRVEREQDEPAAACSALADLAPAVRERHRAARGWPPPIASSPLVADGSHALLAGADWRLPA